MRAMRQAVMLPTISVIIPTFNNGATLPDTIRSVLNQSLQPQEIIVVDDCGEEPLGLDDLPSGGRIRAIRLEKNSGVSVARNAGFELGTGEFVLFLDSDDILAPDFLLRATEALRDHPDAALCMCDAYRCPEPELAETLKRLGPSEGGPLRELQSDDFFNDVIGNTGEYIPSFALFRRSALRTLAEDGMLFSPRLKVSQDTHLFLRMALKHDAVFLHEKLGIYRLRSGSLSNREINLWSCRVQCHEVIASDRAFKAVDAARKRQLERFRSSDIRRYARVLSGAGRQKEALSLLGGDILRSPSLKSVGQYAALVLRLESRGRGDGHRVRNSSRSPAI
jgi:glycosyltransferase involved in cell wall biosynthesis